MKRVLDTGLELDDDRHRINIAAVHDFLSNHAYWALGWSYDEVNRLIDESQRVVGLYDGGRLVGFTRTVSDGHWLTYLADCYVLPEYRGQGHGFEIVRETVDRSPYKNHSWLLHTKSASGLFKKFGFEMRSDYLMERPGTVS